MSTTTTPSTPSIAIFGATGGTGLAVLQEILTSSPITHVNTLCRTPSKLSQFSDKNTYPNLNIIKGDIRDPSAVKSTLINPTTNFPVDIIVSSLGMTPIRSSTFSMKWSDPTICHDGIKGIFDALDSLERDYGAGNVKTKIIVVSTTGISKKGRDIPLLTIPLYRLGKTPHEDKKKMEEEILRWAEKGKRWVVVRPSLLLNGEGKKRAVKVGWEIPVVRKVDGEGTQNIETEGGKEKQEDKLETGYVITRGAVGRWIFQEGIKDGGKSEWEGRFVSLTF
ncbi:hypothetical protein NHQ30_002185 [Ciborinia camelliae]|nr:hypothetical protein NHQ30_002185 [Ciborinia camelliae]